MTFLTSNALKVYITIDLLFLFKDNISLKQTVLPIFIFAVLYFRYIRYKRRSLDLENDDFKFVKAKRGKLPIKTVGSFYETTNCL